MSRSLEEELALFEQEISAVENGLEDSSAESIEESEEQAALAECSDNGDEKPESMIGPAAISGPILPSNGLNEGSSQQPSPGAAGKIRPALPFLPHVMLRPGFLPAPNLGVRLMPPQLRFPLPEFMRPPIPPPQPAVLVSGPSLYEDKALKNKEVEKEKDPEPKPLTMKTQALSSDVELIAQKRHAEAMHRTSYLGRVMRGEKKMKRFLRSCGGQVWEDKSLADWDPNDFRIFCGDLGNEVSDELLAKAFRKYPSFQKAKVIRESRTNKSKGYGFVSFKHQDDFVRACREMDGKYVGNRPIKLRKSNWKERNIETVRKKQKQKQRLGMA